MISSRGDRDDPYRRNEEEKGEAGLIGCALGEAGDELDDEVLERLLKESAEKGYELSKAREGLETGEEECNPRRENSISQCLRPEQSGDIGELESMVERQWEDHTSQCEEAGPVYAGNIGRLKRVGMVFDGRAWPQRDSHPCVQPSDRLTFESCRGEEGGRLDKSRWQAFEECRHNLALVCRKKEVVFGELGEVISEALKGQDDRYMRCSKTTGELFPLPLPSSLKRESQVPPCVDSLVHALNSLYGTKSVGKRRENKTQLMLVERLERDVVSSGLAGERLPDTDFDQFFKGKGVDYSGEEVQVARRFTWSMVEAAFPEAVGSLELEEFCDGGTLEYIRNFESFMLPVEDQFMGKTPSIMVDLEHWPQVCSGLLRRGVCRAMHISDIHHINGKPLLNGLFAVGKNEFQTDESGSQFEVCRLIMNLVPTNGCCRSLTGDTSTLPSVIGMSSIVLEDHQLLVTSSEDIRCFFYLFRTPPSWWRFMAFGRETPEECLPAGCSGTGWHLVTQVLPMGFINSVAIAQHVHRRVINQALKGERKLASGHQEIRRDRHHSRAPHLFRVYLDNYDELKKVDKHLASTIAGTPSVWTLAVRETYERLGLPRHPKKAVTQAVKAEVQGAWVDGDLGRATPKMDKITRYVRLACDLTIIAGKASQRELQVIGGGFVYMAMFRRPLLSGLNRRIVELGPGGARHRETLGMDVVLELLRFIALAPLAYMDFRTAVSEEVTASDASTTGGGLCVSRELSPYSGQLGYVQGRCDLPR